MADKPAEKETVIPVETEKVDGTIQLSEIVARLEENLKVEPKNVRPETAERMATVARLASELRQELAALEAAAEPPDRPAK
jgi:hypothetical protein